MLADRSEKTIDSLELLEIRPSKINDWTEMTKKLLMIDRLCTKDIIEVTMIVMSIHNNSLHQQIDLESQAMLALDFFA